MNTKKKFYGTWIILAAFFIMGGAVGVAWNCNSLFVKAICEDTGFARSQVVFLTTICSAATMIMSLFISKIYKAVSPIKVMRIAAIILPIAYCAISFCKRLPQFYRVQVVVALCIFFTANIPLSIIIGNWYKTGLGTALGISFMGSGLVGMVFNSLVGRLLPIYGWRFTYRILAVSIAVLVIPFVLFVLKETPEAMGLKAMGAGESATGEAVKEEVWGPTAAEAMKSSSFIMVCIAMFMCMVALNSQIQAVSPRLTDLGYSVATASNISALGLGSLAIGKILLGKMYDKMTVRNATCLAVFLGCLAILGEALAKYLAMVALIVIGEGISCAMGTVGMPVFVKGLYGNRDYNAIYGKIMAIGNAGGVLGPLFLNAMYDKTGSYDIALWVCFAFDVIALVIFAKILGKKKD